MANVAYNDNPTVSDTVVFDLITTDEDGEAIDAYRVDQIIIYFIERGTTVENINKYTTTIVNDVYTEYFKEAVPVGVFGNDDMPAWIGTDEDNAFVTHITEDDEGEPLTGVFRLEWIPELMREGNYVLCYQWTPIMAGDKISQNIEFYLSSNTRNTTSIPSHLTAEGKYETLLERYTPEMFKMLMADNDMTPEVLDKLNKAIAQGFTEIENQGNQLGDLFDANSVNDYLLPYLGNFFSMGLKGSDTTMWRRQIKRAIPLYKKKGTLDGLKEALANADVQFKKYTRLWQVVSQSTWQDGFVVTEEDAAASPPEFELTKEAILPIDEDNFELYHREVDTTTYTTLTSDYVDLSTSGGVTTMTWVGDMLSFSPVTLQAGDVIRIVYKYAEPASQTVEDYIRTLPLADLRDEVDVTYPKKNWNVRVIGEDDAMIDLVMPSRHSFTYPLVYGKVRTIFPYSENIYNMEEYNGSTRDSTNPCDLDKDFLDSCTNCVGSKFTLDVEIEDLSNERLEEIEDIVKDFVPFDAIVHSINYSGSKNEFISSPTEEIECLGRVVQIDNVIATQMNFNRLIEDGLSDAQELKRNMLASASTTNHTGSGVNLAVVLFSPGVNFATLGVDTEGDTFLEILSGADAGEYKIGSVNKYTADIVQGAPDTITWPVDTSAFPFRLSNEMFSGTVDIEQQYDYVFSDPDEDVIFAEYGIKDDWNVVVTAGPHAGTYAVSAVNPNNTISLASFPTASPVTGLDYELRTASNALRYTGTAGVVNTTGIGKVTMDVDAYEFGVRSDHYVLHDGTQYRVRGVDEFIWLDDYEALDDSGVSVKIYDRILDNAVGYLDIRGMQLTGTVPTVSYDAEIDEFRENYLILIGVNYYQIESIDGSDMVINGPILSWGLSGTSVDYSIVHLEKTSPITTLGDDNPFGNLEFDRLDRRGNESIEIETETAVPMFARATMLNDANAGHTTDTVTQQEQVWYSIEYKE